MEQYKVAAGAPKNEAIQYVLRRKKYELKTPKAEKPKFPLNLDKRSDHPQHYGWNPVYWSDYPKQPMWTVPLPKIAAPILFKQLKDPPVLPCHIPPSEHMSPKTCPVWIPDLPRYSPHFNPYIDETNEPFIELLGPPKL